MAGRQSPAGQPTRVSPRRGVQQDKPNTSQSETSRRQEREAAGSVPRARLAVIQRCGDTRAGVGHADADVRRVCEARRRSRVLPRRRGRRGDSAGRTGTEASGAEEEKQQGGCASDNAVWKGRKRGHPSAAARCGGATSTGTGKDPVRKRSDPPRAAACATAARAARHGEGAPARGVSSKDLVEWPRPCAEENPRMRREAGLKIEVQTSARTCTLSMSVTSFSAHVRSGQVPWPWA